MLKTRADHLPKLIVEIRFQTFKSAEKPLSADAVVTGIVARIVNSFRMFGKTRSYNFSVILMRPLQFCLFSFIFCPLGGSTFSSQIL